jgi:hypothetical protein
MSGTLNANFVQSDVGANLYLNTGLSSGSVTIGNTSPLIANTISANTVGIGTTSPTNSLDVVGNVRSILQTSGDFTGVSLNNNGSTNPRIQFSTSDGSPRYFIQANGNSSLDFVTVLAGTNYTAMSLGRTTNNLVFGQNGSGIQFTNSSAITNSVLNDYEVGTFTPTVIGGLTSISYGQQSGTYTKIGNVVLFQITMGVTGSTQGSGQLGFGGLPFTSTNANTNGGAWFNFANVNFINSTSTNLPTMYINGSSTNMYFYQTNGSTFIGTNLAAGSFTISISGFYYATF